MPYTYMLQCGDGSFYVGSARSLDARLGQHVAGVGGAYTAKRQPVTLVWFEEFKRIDEAWSREKQLQGWSRAKRLALIEGRLHDLAGLSRSRELRDG